MIGTFGYNCRSGKCDLMELPDDPIDPTKLYYGVAFSIPTFIVVTSYSIIWIYVRHSSKYLKRR